jgi:glutathione S-transferase/alpha,alpha-trehalase
MMMKPPMVAAMAFAPLVSFCLCFQHEVQAFSISLLTSAGNSAAQSSSALFAELSGKTLTLYGHQGSRSPLVNWAANELGLDEMSMGNLPENPHPFKKIPCLTDDGDVVVFESGAILEYLQDNYYGNSKTPTLTKAQRAAITSWIVWANASLDPVCFIETPQGKVYDTGLKYGHPSLDRLNALFKDQNFLLGNDLFSLADVAVASYLLYVPQFFPDVSLKAWPHLARYMRDCASREAYGKAFGPKVQGYLLEYLEAFSPKGVS